MQSNHPTDGDPVVVIGASAAGLLAAQHLAQRQVPVDVYERVEHGIPLSRTLIVTPELQRVLGASAASATVNTVHTLELCSNGRAVPIRLREPDLIVERAELLRVLERRASEAGARIRRGHEFAGVHVDGDRTLVQLRARGSDRRCWVIPRAVIAADGTRSQVARSLALLQRPTVTVLQARVARPPTEDPGVGKVWFVPRDTPYFYWLCPESDRTAAVGIVDGSPREARGKLDRFLADRGLEPLEYQAALIPLYTSKPPPAQRLGRMQVLFVGDAAGQVKVTTIGGTVTGLRGAQAAARAIANGTPYTRELAGVDRELRLHLWIRSLMGRFGDREYDALLRLLAGSAGRLLEIHNRDQLAGVFWSIMARQPGLPLLAARVLWRAGLP
jgi:digeranylgeranylglycerophospholipid reductase